MIDENEIRHVRLMITERCNLNCSYCYLRKKGAKDMSPDTAEKGVELLLSSPGDYKEIYFFGGEPLLRFDTVMHTILFAERLKRIYRKTVSYEINTNGILLDEEKLAFLSKYGVRIAFSIDGKEDTFVGLRGSKEDYNKAISNLKAAIRASGEEARARMTIHPSKAKELFSNFRYMYDLGVKKIAVGPVQGMAWSSEDIRSFAQNIDKIVSFFLEEVRAGKTIYVTFISEYMDSLTREDKGRALCYMGEGINIEWDGNFTACSYCSQLAKNEQLKDMMSIGNVAQGINREKRKYFLDFLLCKAYPLKCEKCRKFLCNHICFVYSPEGEKYPQSVMENHYRVRKTMYLAVKKMYRSLLQQKDFMTLKKILAISGNMHVKSFCKGRDQ